MKREFLFFDNLLVTATINYLLGTITIPASQIRNENFLSSQAVLVK